METCFRMNWINKIFPNMHAQIYILKKLNNLLDILSRIFLDSLTCGNFSLSSPDYASLVLA